jgi:peroxiredoxin
MKTPAIAFLTLWFAAVPLLANDNEKHETDLLEGHSSHGEAFNEGPRQAATLMGNTGKVEFDLTSNSRQAKKFFIQGLGQLHGFWYFEAERSFRQCAALDDSCAIAYWGMAQANIENEERARGFLAEAIRRMKPVTEREQLYIKSFAAYLGIPDTVEELDKIDDLKTFTPKGKKPDRCKNYVTKLEELILAYPDDIEAKAYLLVTLWQNTRKGVPLTSTFAADAIAQQIFDKNPIHPAHHFRIHIWDRRKASTALDSAAMCGFTAPTIAHMWHMPGHIYDKEKRYADAAWHQEASARTDHRHMMEDRVLPDQIHNYAHNNEWLTRTLTHLGRISDALDLAKNMTELPRHPTYNTLEKGSARFGRMRLRNVLLDAELWNEALDLVNGPYLEPTDLPKEQINRLELKGIAAFGLNKLSEGTAVIGELTSLREALLKKHQAEEKEKAQKAAEKKESEAGKDDGESKDDAEPGDDTSSAEKQSEEADEGEDTKAKKEPKLPPDVIFADSVIKELELAKALAEGHCKDILDAKDFKPQGINKHLLLKAYLTAENTAKAIELSKKEVNARKNQTLPLARHIHALYTAGKIDDARKAFDELRTISEDVELDVPVFHRLAPIASAFKLPADWRQKRPTPDDIRRRPDLNDLGPFRWRPGKAPSWVLADHNGDYTSLAEQNLDQDILLIFYLGAECLHCVQQLGVFAPMVKDYEKAGIKIIGVSLESRDELRQSILDYGAGGIDAFGAALTEENIEGRLSRLSLKSSFPFMLLADPTQETFKAYRAFDDFEQKALHGTFLIDKRGFIRWQDISYEPFDKPEYLLKECKRLLAQPDSLVHGPRPTSRKKLLSF